MEFVMLFRTGVLASVALLFATPGNAATYYVAANGMNTACTAAAPCATLSTALNAATGAGDSIVCLSPPAVSYISITRSVTIDCSTARAPVRDLGTNAGGAITGISINVPLGDAFRTVRLRGLYIDGSLGSAYYLMSGIDIQAAAAVYIEDCVISNAYHQGIYDHRTGGQTKLFIKDSIISGGAGPGIVAASAAVGITVLDNVTSENNAYGIAAATGNNVTIRNSVFSGNSTAGIEGDAGAQITVYNSTISHNNIGVQSQSSVRVSNNGIEFNNTAFSGSAGTLGLNRYSGNGSIGTAPMPISGAPADVGP
jgi:hypothetical protein